MPAFRQPPASITLSRTLPLPLPLLILGAFAAHAQTTDAPAAATPAGPLPALAAQRGISAPGSTQPESFLVTNVHFTGVTALSNAELADVVSKTMKRQTTLEELQTVADAVTQRYHDEGYFAAKAVVPAQEVRDGVVEISVIEGKIGEVRVKTSGKLPISDERVQKSLAHLESGKPLNNSSYERAMLLLSDTPGLKVQSSLQEGSAPGTTDLEVELARKRPWVLSVDADNNGTRPSGRERFGVTGRWLSPLGIGDNLDARFLISSNASIGLGRLSYEAPIGYDGWRAGVGYSRVEYELGGLFAALDARGNADIADVFVSYPLIRSRDENAYFRLTADYKKLDDELRAVNLDSKKDIYGAAIGTVYEARDSFLGGGYVNQSLAVYHGHLHIRDQVTQFLDASVFGHDTEGDFTKFNFQLGRLQAIVPRVALYTSVAGQFAGENLDSSEKLNLGGAGSVRAFPNSELLVDDGFSASAELRVTVLEDVTLAPFYDFGRGRAFHAKNGFDGDLWRSISGPGIGVTWARAGNFTIISSVAWRDHGEQLTEGNDHQPRWFWQVQKSF